MYQKITKTEAGADSIGAMEQKPFEKRASLKSQIKKIVLSFVLIILTVAQVAAQDSKNGWENDKLKGKVKSIEYHWYDAIDKFGEITKGEKIFSIDGHLFKKFDNNGNVIEDAMYGSTGGFFSRYKYDDKGNRIEEMCYYEDNYSDRNLRHKTIYKYDDKGNQIEISCYKPDGNLSYKEIYKYDGKRNLIEESLYNPDGSFDYKWIYKHDDKGNKIEKNRYKSEDKIFKYKYDDKGNEIESIEYWSNGELYKTTSEYDDHGNVVECSVFQSDGRLNHKIIRKYNDRGNEIEENRYKFDGSLEHKSITEYKYDKKGNWIEEITYTSEAKIPIFIEERIINYYE
ncbi:MAG: hypothetical protein LBK94_11055 [Prevotellaceae bacterium]|jgi:YD repeat-containing protein|nr:hypothetical protein [Prevotellaceae bacterium]